MAAILRARAAGADYRTEVRWAEESVLDGYGRRVLLYVLTASDGSVGGRPYLPEMPLVPRDRDGYPLCRLVLRLRRPPTLEDGALGPLIDQAAFTLTLSMDVGLDAPYRPQFARAVTCTLEGRSAAVAEGTGAGAGARMTLTAPSLAPDVGFDILNALHGATTRLVVRTVFDLRATGAPTGAAEFEQPLEAVLGGLGLDPSRIIEILAPARDGRGYERLPSLVSARRDRGAPRAASVPVMMTAHHFVPIATAVSPQPAAALNAHALMASDAVVSQSALSHRINVALINDLVLLPIEPSPVLEHLPLVDDVAAPLFRDRADPSSYWYPPVFTLKSPAPADDPSSSAFVFHYRRTGVNPGPPPRPTLDATVRFVLETAMSNDTAGKLAELNHPPASPLPLDGLSVTLDLPYMEHGAPQVQSFAAQVEQSGTTITAIVPLLDDAVRMAYGSLAYPDDFQSQPAALRVAYTYRGYAPLPAGGFHLVAGGKIALMPAALGRELTRALPAGAAATIMVKPSLLLDSNAVQLVPQPQYAVRSVGRDQRIDAKFACASFGAFYFEVTTDQGTKPVGCTDALKLGEITVRLYDEVADLRDSRFRVYRSLTQPGVFLIIPTTYRIARLGRSDGDKAFRPAVMVYSVVDPDPAKNKFFLQATLQPDIPVDARIALATALAAKTPLNQPPVVRYPTDLSYSKAPEYHWMLPAGIDTPSVQLLPDSFAVGLSADLDNALLVLNVIEQNGLGGSVTFVFDDGTSMSSALALDTAFTGPWDTGPVEGTIAAGTVTLTNRIERPVNVFDLFTRAGTEAPRQSAVNATLAPGESRGVPAGEGVDAAYCTCAVGPGPVRLDELDIFVEDVTTNVLFVNQVSLAAHGLTGLSAEARLKGTDHVYSVPDVSGPSTSLTLTLPLTAYLDAQTLEYRVTKIAAGASSITTPWLQADLRRTSVVSLTWELIGP